MNIKFALLVSALIGAIVFLPIGSLADSATYVTGARLKDIATVKGVRENVLIGYGLVVGLKGTGDSSADVTAKSLGRLFGKLGLDVDKNASIKSKNAAAVIVTAKLPEFSRSGNKVDVTVSSIGDASSLEGGMLLITPLRAGDQQVYAVAQGPVSLGANADGSGKVFPTVGRVVDGGMIEKDVENNFSDKKSFRLTLHHADFTTAARVVALLNAELGGKFASARDSATIDIMVPFNYDGNTVELMARVENVRVNIDSKAKVVLNERTGTIVMGDRITLLPVVISHGDLSIEVKGEKGKAQHVFEIKAPTVADLVRLLNSLNVQPKDLTAIFQTLKETGALQADLEFM